MKLARRELLIGGSGALALAVPGRLLAQRHTGFTHGVASGEPTATSVLVWTRFVGARNPVSLKAEISDTPDFRRITAWKTTFAAPKSDWTARTTLTGLDPGRVWFYRFIASDGSKSPVGRTRTFADGLAERLRIGVFSCSNLPFGWFNAYAHAAADRELDLAIHLGDYIYEYPRGTYPSTSQTIPGRHFDPDGAIVALTDYRQRYASYRRDPDLQALHAHVPWLAVWDDHEFADNAARNSAYNHNAKTEGSWSARKRAAAQAWREWMPVSHDNRPSVRDAGSLASFVMLETRVTGRMAPVDFYALQNTPGDLKAKLVRFRDEVWKSPDQLMLGNAQESFVTAELKAAPTRTRWQILVNSVPMGNCVLPAAARGWPVAGGSEGQREIELLAACGEVGLPFNMDNWNGFPLQRGRVLKAAQDGGGSTIILSGDSHNAWAYRLSENGNPAGVEMAVPGVTSPGFEAWFPMTDPTVTAKALVETNAELEWCDTSRRGYGRIELTPDRARLDWLFTDPVRRRSNSAAVGYTININT